MKTATAPASGQLAALFGPDMRPTLRRIGESPVSAEAAAAQTAVWGALAEAGGLRTDDIRAVLPIAELMGESLYRSPYFDTLTAIDALAAATGPERQPTLLDAARDGEIAFAVAWPDLRFVRCADMADLLLVVDGPAMRLVELHRPGVEITEHSDLGRGGLFKVAVEDGTAPILLEAGLGPLRWEAILDRARLRQAAYLTGLCRGALELATAHARQRIIFGRTLGAHQAPAFRLAALAAGLEAVRSLVYRADRPAQSLLLAGELAAETAAAAVQLHGASGLLEENDAQLFYRRALTEAALFREPAR